MKHITNLTADLGTLYQELRAGTVDIKLATELNNTAGKIISAHKTQLAYHALRDEAPEIPFLAAKKVTAKGKPAPALELHKGNKKVANG